jgi:hypothetical protein
MSNMNRVQITLRNKQSGPIGKSHVARASDMKTTQGHEARPVGPQTRFGETPHLLLRKAPESAT